MEAVGNPDANLPPERGHGFEGQLWGGEDFSTVEEVGPYEDLSKVAGGSGVQALVKFG